MKTFFDIKQDTWVTREISGYYLYVLVNPVSGLPFYVGKGKNLRAWNHRESDYYNHDKKVIIEQIRKSGKVYKVAILDNLDENVACTLEPTFIKMVNEKYNITNKVKTFQPPQQERNSYSTINIDLLRSLYVDSNLSIDDCCRILNISRYKFDQIRSVHGIYKDRTKSPNILRGKNRIYITNGYETKISFDGNIPLGWRRGRDNDSIKKSATTRKTVIDRDLIEKLYIVENRRFKEVVSLLNTTPDILRANIKSYKISKTKQVNYINI